MSVCLPGIGFCAGSSVFSALRYLLLTEYKSNHLPEECHLSSEQNSSTLSLFQSLKNLCFVALR